MTKITLPFNAKYTRTSHGFSEWPALLVFFLPTLGYANDIESLMRISDEDTLERIDDDLLNDASSIEQRMNTQ